MIKKKFDPSIPRKMLWSNEIPNSKLCPNCDTKLEKEYHSYVIAIRKGTDHEYSITGNGGGYFYPSCKIVVLDRDKFGELASHATKFSDPFDFTVLGIVDLNAIPEDKKNIPLGGEDNPVPLVEFTNLSKKDKWSKGTR